MNRRGFTLVELLLTLMLTGILFASAGILMTQGLRSYIVLSDRSVALQGVRYAVERMVRELDQVPESGIQNIQADQIGFIDGLGNNADFNWNAQSQILYRGADKLLERVSQFGVTAYKSDGTTTSAAVQARRVRLQLSCLPAGQTTPIRLETEVYLKNYTYDNYL